MAGYRPKAGWRGAEATQSVYETEQNLRESTSRRQSLTQLPLASVRTKIAQLEQAGKGQENKLPASSKTAWRMPWGPSATKKASPSPHKRNAKKGDVSHSRLSRFSAAGQSTSSEALPNPVSSPQQLHLGDTSSPTQRQRPNPLSRMWSNLKSSTKPRSSRQSPSQSLQTGADQQDATATKLRFSPRGTPQADRRRIPFSDASTQENGLSAEAAPAALTPKSGLLRTLAAGAAQAVQRKRQEQAAQDPLPATLTQTSSKAADSNVLTASSSQGETQPNTLSQTQRTVPLQETASLSKFSTPEGPSRGGKLGLREASAAEMPESSPAQSYEYSPMDIDSPFLNQTPWQKPPHTECSETDTWHDTVDLQEAMLNALEAEQEHASLSGAEMDGRAASLNLGSVAGSQSAGGLGVTQQQPFMPQSDSNEVKQILQQAQEKFEPRTEDVQSPTPGSLASDQENADVQSPTPGSIASDQENAEPPILLSAPQAPTLAMAASFQRSQGAVLPDSVYEMPSPQLSIPATPGSEELHDADEAATPGVIFCATNSIFSPLPGERSLDSHRSGSLFPTAGATADFSGAVSGQTQQSIRSLRASLSNLSKADRDTPSLEDKFNLMHYPPAGPSSRLSFGATPLMVSRSASENTPSLAASNLRTRASTGRPSLSSSSRGHNAAQPASTLPRDTAIITPPNQASADPLIARRSSIAEQGSRERGAVSETEHQGTGQDCASGDTKPLRNLASNPAGSSLTPAQQGLDPSWAEEYKKLLAGDAEAEAAELEHEESWLQLSQMRSGNGSDKLDQHIAAAVGAAVQAARISGLQARALLAELYPALERMLLESFEADRTRREVLEITTSSLQESLRAERQGRSEAQSTFNARIALLESDLVQVRSQYAEQEKQFKILHRDKYVPLKESAANISQELEEERSRRRALQQEAQLLSQDVQQVQQQKARLELDAQGLREDVAALREEAAALQGELEAAHARAMRAEAQRGKDVADLGELQEEIENCQSQLMEQQEQHRVEMARKDATLQEAEKVVAAAEKERREANAAADFLSAQLESLRAKSSARQPQADPHTAAWESSRQKDEIYDLKSRLHNFKAENDRFVNTTAHLEAEVDELKTSLATKTEEHSQLLKLCDELLKMQEAKQGLS